MSLGYRCIRKVGYFLRLRLETQPGWVWRFAMAALSWGMRLHGLTLRYVVEDKPGYFADRLGRPVIFLLWHNRIASMPVFYERRRRHHRLRAVVLTSASPEGSLLAQVLAHFSLGAVRGSTSRRASVAVREMANRIAEGHDIIACNRERCILHREPAVRSSLFTSSIRATSGSRAGMDLPSRFLSRV
jgi:uncharacterized protein DUF374